MMTLVTGFGPFLTNAENPSAKLAETSGQDFKILEVSYQAVEEFLNDLDPTTFDRLLMIGLKAKGRKMLLETRARNKIGRTSDVRNHIPETEIIDPNDRRIKPSTLWTENHKAHEKIGTSQNAGAYLCNYIFYRALTKFPDKQVGFLHVPPFTTLNEETQKVILQKLLAI